MTLPPSLNYPIIAIADLHGQLDQLKRLVTRLKMVSEWNDCALVFHCSSWSVMKRGTWASRMVCFLRLLPIPGFLGFGA